jgi:hypothetical protein
MNEELEQNKAISFLLKEKRAGNKKGNSKSILKEEARE